MKKRMVVAIGVQTNDTHVHHSNFTKVPIQFTCIFITSCPPQVNQCAFINSKVLFHKLSKIYHGKQSTFIITKHKLTN